MPVTDQDARALAYLASRIRTEANAPRWDAAGIEAVIAKLVGRGLVASIERVTRHAADKDAQTPGAILRPFVPEAEVNGPPRPPKPGEQCHTCGYHVPRCVCDQPTTRPPVKSERNAEHIEVLRRQIRTEETK